MEKTTTEEWLGALHTSSERLDRQVSTLSEKDLARPSFAEGWSIAHVLSHLGSGAEISAMLVERGIKGLTNGPVREEVLPIWERWDALPPLDQRAAWQDANARHLGLLDSAQRTSVKVPYFAGLLNITDYTGYRLSEHSVHGWDIAVALDPTATIPADELRLLWKRADLIASRFRNADTLSRLAPAQLAITLTDEQRTLLLDLDCELHIYPANPADPVGTVTGTADTVLRLVYGRHRPGGDAVTTAGQISLDDLRALFPGF
ncbi:maleylpyruvate isomerase family mycothiol-dependent enzyme [Streptomyces sp. S1D4-11]|nr:maleylpyruvate isomerase family mycothiol-dependent enzyme [Streptomyces sp. S1D4-11]QIZ00783.1 maleylpyruvate isomerase family mycothiol-dependent enzyme [Streptomyces sp. S1D4-11]